MIVNNYDKNERILFAVAFSHFSHFFHLLSQPTRPAPSSMSETVS
jgi:hypothetical protein